MAKRKQEPELVRKDGALCLTFVNSASSKRRSFSVYAELLDWGLAAGTLTGADLERLGRAVAERRADGGAVVRQALELRARFARIFEGVLRRQGPLERDLAALEAAIASALSARRLVPSGLGCRWVWGDRGGDELDRMLWPVVMSMADLLRSPKSLARVRRCAGEDCGLLFVDRTPGSPRKWCSMKACGSKVKAKRDYYRRVKPAREAAHRGISKERREKHQKAREAREREAEEAAGRRDDRRPGPQVA